MASGEVSAAVAAARALRAGSSALAEWLDRRTQRRYEQFIAAAIAGDVFDENAEAMTPDDLFAILRSLELDIEAEKASLYGQLACSIATGTVKHEYKRHFIKALRELSFAQLQALRRAWVASKYQLRPALGAGEITEGEFLSRGADSAIAEAAFAQFGLASGEKLQPLGATFVCACFTASELTPASIGERQWADGKIQVICNELGNAQCRHFIGLLADLGQKRAVRVTNSGVDRRNTTNYRIFGGELVVLLFQDADELSEQWEGIVRITKPRATFVTVSQEDPGASWPSHFAEFEHFNLSINGEVAAAQVLLDRFEKLLKERSA